MRDVNKDIFEKLSKLEYKDSFKLDFPVVEKREVKAAEIHEPEEDGESTPYDTLITMLSEIVSARTKIARLSSSIGHRVEAVEGLKRSLTDIGDLVTNLHNQLQRVGI